MRVTFKKGKPIMLNKKKFKAPSTTKMNSWGKN